MSETCTCIHCTGARLLDALRPVAQFVSDNVERIESALVQVGQQFAGDVEDWLAIQEAHNRPLSDSDGLDDQLHAPDDGEGA